jgi:hypothetical protein
MDGLNSLRGYYDDVIEWMLHSICNARYGTYSGMPATSKKGNGQYERFSCRANCARFEANYLHQTVPNFLPVNQQVQKHREYTSPPLLGSKSHLRRHQIQNTPTPQALATIFQWTQHSLTSI